jgi:asparagine synthetase B (glutamine-hydrolysing)
MCGFSLVPSDQWDETANATCQRRGPDLTTVRTFGGYTATHNTLFVTGDPTPQPLVENGVLVMFNGEVYNYKELRPSALSDVHAILEAYATHGKLFATALDGEYAVVILDTNTNKLIVASDPFCTKPLYISESNLSVATYASCLGGSSKCCPFPPNTWAEYDVSTKKKIASGRVVTWDLRQHKGNYTDWCAAFEAAVCKRATGITQGVPFVGMSSGYDSGAICAVLNKHGAAYRTYTIPGKENMSVINSRLEHNNNNATGALLTVDMEREHQHLQEHAEDATLANATTSVLRHGEAPCGLSCLCRKAKSDGLLVYLSGQGCDEIVSDYAINGKSKYGDNDPRFCGVFPSDLCCIFDNDPTQQCIWVNFYHGKQREYLLKEEFVAGSHGLEARYPFLDKNVVQEYLWLDYKLKNAEYKAPVARLLQTLNYPYEKDVKMGFNVSGSKKTYAATSLLSHRRRPK